MNLQLQNLDLRYEECPSFDSLPLSFGLLELRIRPGGNFQQQFRAREMCRALQQQFRAREVCRASQMHEGHRHFTS